MKQEIKRLSPVLIIVMLVLIVPVLCFLGSGFAIAEDLFSDLPAIDLPEKPSLPTEALAKAGMPGRTEGTGKNFEIKDSDYLNIKLTSIDEIKVMLESVPGMISLNIEPVSDETAMTVLTLEGLEPNKTYYKYQDSYKNEGVFNSDGNGTYSWTQDLTQPHHVWFQEEKGTIFFPDNCSNYGTWDPVTLTCTLTQDLNESIEIVSNGVTLDCNGHSLIGNGSGNGVYVYQKDKVNIKNCSVSGFSNGILLIMSSNSSIINNTVFLNSYRGIDIRYFSDSNEVIGNTVSGNLWGISIETSSSNNRLINNISNSNSGIGIWVFYSYKNTLSGNTMLDNKYSFWLQAGSDLEHDNDIDITNLVEGRPIYYIKGVVDKTYDESTNASTFYCIDCDNVVIKNLVLNGNANGLYLWKTHDSRIENVSTIGNWIGLFSNHSYNNVFTGNHIQNNGYRGFSFLYSDINQINHNIVLSNGGYGVEIVGSNSNIVDSNNITVNDVGTIVVSSDDNIFTNNFVSLSRYGGITVYWANRTRFYHNNFVENTIQASIPLGYGSFDIFFDNGYPSGGNYWSDYTGVDLYSGPTQDQPGADGTGDTPYTFTGGQDRYPFIQENGWENLPSDQPPVCDIKLQQNGSAIDKISINEFFDIYTRDSTDDIGITSVRFSSDDSQNGSVEGAWTDWFGWNASLGDWDSQTKIKKWSFATNGEKEVWVEVKDGSGQTSQCSANISIVPWSFAIITDLHIGWGIPDYDGEGYSDLITGQDYFITKRLKETVEWINDNYKDPKYNIKFVVIDGDITDTAEYSEFLKAKEILNNLEIPYVPLLGNHDIWPYTQKTNADPDNRIFSFKGSIIGDVRGKLGDEYFEMVFWQNNAENVQKIESLFNSFERQEELDAYRGTPYFQNYAFTYGGVNFTSLDFSSRNYGKLIYSPMSSEIYEDTMKWLGEQLKECDGGKNIVFTHFPFSAYPPDVGFWVWDFQKIIDFLQSYNCKIYNFAGHMHINFTRELQGRHEVVVTEAVIQPKMFPLASWGKFIRIAQVNDDGISYDTLIDGFPAAINPYFIINRGEVAVGEDITFKAYTKNLKPDEILSYKWDFNGDNVYEVDSIYSYPNCRKTDEYYECKIKYQNPGTYKITLEVTPVKNSEYSENTSWSIEIKEQAKTPFKIFLPLPGLIPLLNGENINLSQQANAQNTTEWAVITKVTSPGKPVGAINIHFEQATEDIDLSGVIADIDLQKRKSIFYMTSWSELVEEEKILFIPSTGAGSMYVCPNATSLEEVNPLCNDVVVLNTRKEKDGIIATTILYNGQEYYLVFGVKGTGGGEFGIIEKMIKDLNNYIQSLPDATFINNTFQRKNALQNKLEEVFIKIENEEYQEAINKLRKDIWAKFDGDLATTAKDWIISTEAILELSIKMNEFIAYFQSFL